MASAGAGQAVEIRIRNPEKHGQAPNVYLTYEVSTTGLSADGGETSVRRRYSDFLWLRAALAEKFPTSLIPSLAEKERLGPSDASESRFVEQRRKDLERFCHRVISHPNLSKSKDLRMFLEARVWAIESHATSSSAISSLASGVAGGNVGRMLFSLTKDADEALRRITGAEIDTSDPEHQRIQNLSQHTAKLEENLQKAHEAVKKMQKRHEGVASDVTEISSSFSTLAQAEDELSDAYRAVSTTFDKTGKIISDHAVMDELLMREPLRGVVLDTGAARDVIRGREAALLRLVEARESRARLIKELEQAHLAVNQPKQRTAFQLFTDTLAMTDKPEEKINALKLKVKEADIAIGDAEKGLQAATRGTSDEVRRFHRTCVHDIKGLLLDYVKSQREYHQRMQDAWSDLLPQLEAIEIQAPPSGQVLSPGNFEGGEPVEAGAAIRSGGDDDETLAEFED